MSISPNLLLKIGNGNKTAEPIWSKSHPYLNSGLGFGAMFAVIGVFAALIFIDSHTSSGIGLLRLVAGVIGWSLIGLIGGVIVEFFRPPGKRRWSVKNAHRGTRAGQ